MTYAEMMQRYAAVAGLPRRRILPVPFFTPVAVQPLGRPDHAGAGRHRPPAGRVAAQHRRLPRARHRRATSPTRRRACSASTRPSGWRCSASATPPSRPAGPRRRCPARPSDPLPTDPDWAGGSLYVDERTRTTTAAPGRAVAGRRGHRRRHRLVLLPAGLAGPRLAGPAGRRRRPAPRPARPAPALRRRRPRLLAGRGDRRAAGCCGCAPRCGCPAWPGWSSTWNTTSGGRRRPCCGSGPPSPRTAWPATLYWWAIAAFHGIVFGGMIRGIARAADARGLTRDRVLAHRAGSAPST